MPAKKNRGVPTDKTYILELSGGRQRRLYLKEGQHVTFGPTAPGTRGGSQTALRVYQGDCQLAAFTDVQAFRDAALPIEEKKVTVQRRSAGKDAPTGYKNAVVEARIEKWVSPDEPDDPEDINDFLSLPDGFEE